MADASNGIGEGALILTTSADAMLDGLDAVGRQAAAKARGISDKVDAASGGKDKKGGGFLGGLVGGLAGAGIFTALVKGPELAMRAFAELEKRATGLDKGALTGIKNTFRGIQTAGLGILQKFVTAAAPAIMVLGGALLNLFQKLGPLIDGAAQVFEAFAFVGAALIEELVNSIGDLGISTEGWGDATLEVLRFVSKGFAYLWDTVKAGAGVIAVVAGFIIQGFGEVVKVIGEAVKMLHGLAQKLPKGLRPDWIGRVGNEVKGWGDRVERFGAGLKNWGKGAIQGFGQSAQGVDAWFDRVKGRLQDTKNGLKDLAGAMELKLTGAMLGGSAEAFSAVAKFQTNASGGRDIAKEQLGVQRAMRDDIRAVRRALERKEPLEAV